MIHWRDLTAEAAEALARSGIADPEISARRIGQAATGTEGADWLAALDQPATKRQVAAFDAMVARRRVGEPLQYVVGGWGFRTLDLFVDARVLIPRPETEVVAGAAIAEIDRLSQATSAQATSVQPDAPVLTVADLGTGSGAIGLSVAAERPDTDVWLTDMSTDALAVARANLAGLGRAGGRVRIAHGNWFDALDPDLAGRLSVVVSNPPYVAADDEIEAQVGEWEPAEALFAPDEGLVHLRHLVSQAGSWLVDTGALVLEMSPGQVDRMGEMAADFFVQVETISDLAGRSRGLIGRHPRRA